MADASLPSPRQKLNGQQERFVQAYATPGLSVTDAATRAGYSPHTAGNQGYRLLQQPKIQSRLREVQAALKKRDVTLDRLAKKLSDGLDCTKVLVTRRGRRLEVPDHPTQQECVKTGFKLYGCLGNDPGEDATREIPTLVLDLNVTAAAIVEPPALSP